MSRGIVVATTSSLLSCCMMFAASAAASGDGGGRGSRYNAIFNFGDSMSDTGNLCPDGRPLQGDVVSIFSRSPYGATYFGKPTCRCCDGRVYVDFLDIANGLMSASVSTLPKMRWCMSMSQCQ